MSKIQVAIRTSLILLDLQFNCLYSPVFPTDLCIIPHFKILQLVGCGTAEETAVLEQRHFKRFWAFSLT